MISYVKFFGLVLTASVCLKPSYFNIGITEDNSEYQKILKSISGIFSDGYSEKKQDTDTNYYFGVKHSETSISFFDGKKQRISLGLTDKKDKIDFNDLIPDNDRNNINEDVSVLNASLNASNGVIHNEISAVKNIGIKNEEEFNLKEYYRDDLNLSNLFKNISEKNLFKIKVCKSEQIDDSLVESKFLIVNSFDLIPNLLESSSYSNFLFVSDQDE